MNCKERAEKQCGRIYGTDFAQRNREIRQGTLQTCRESKPELELMRSRRCNRSATTLRTGWIILNITYIYRELRSARQHVIEVTACWRTITFVKLILGVDWKLLKCPLLWYEAWPRLMKRDLYVRTMIYGSFEASLPPPSLHFLPVDDLVVRQKYLVSARNNVFEIVSYVVLYANL
jgi:hypothetical protein